MEKGKKGGKEEKKSREIEKKRRRKRDGKSLCERKEEKGRKEGRENEGEGEREEMRRRERRIENRRVRLLCTGHVRVRSAQAISPTRPQRPKPSSSL